MLIISKYKDYYDYLKGIYGEDEKLVLDRRAHEKPLISEKTIITLHIGEWKVQGYYFEKNFYYGDEVKQFSTSTFELNSRTEDKNWCILNDYKNKSKFYPYNFYCLKKPLFLGDKSPTWEQGCPILVEINCKKFIKFPILREYNLQKVFPPTEVWQILSAWLGKQITKNEPDVPIGDDKIRLQSAGFDLKTSFRNIK